MKEYLSRAGLGKIVVYTAEEYLETTYITDGAADYLKGEGYAVIVLPSLQLHKTVRRRSYLFNEAMNVKEAVELFKLKVVEEKEYWMERLLKTINFGLDKE